MRVFIAVVDVGKHHVLESDEVPWCVLEIAATGGHEFPQRIFAVQRHETVTQVIIRCMQGYGKCDRHGLTQAVDGGNDAGGRNRDASPGQSVAVIVEHEPQRRDEGVEVCQRLTHAHQHHVADDALAFVRGTGCLDRPQGAIGMPELADDFGGRQVTVETLLAGRAERAVERTAHLRGNAQRSTIRLRYKNRFDRIAVPDPKQPLARTISRGDVAQRLRPADLRFFGQPRPQ